MIKLENIKKEYVVKKSVAVALNDVSLTLPDKGLVFVVGRSGCGKTTLYELQVSDYLFLFVIIIVTSIIASLFPLLRLSRKTPRELMIK